MKDREQNTNQVLATIEKRSSARAYSSKPLTEEQLDTVLKAGLMAPTATNRQELHFTAVKGANSILQELDDEKNRLRGLDKQPHNFYYEAPVVILVSGEDAFSWSRVDAGIAVENMALAAESLGLGNLIIGCIYDAMHGEKQEYFAQKLQIPEGYSFQIALAVGEKTDHKEPHQFDYGKQVSVLGE